MLIEIRIERHIVKRKRQTDRMKIGIEKMVSGSEF